MREECKNPRPRERLLLLLDCTVISLACAVLIGPLWRIEYLRNWGSIDSTFIADARFLREHWPHPLWLPLWYCGTRFDYIYPPALRYGTASIAMLWGVSTARAYHLYTALLYCAGSAGVYALLRASGSSRIWGWLGAVATASVSPSYLFLRSFREDSMLHMPQRLNVLLKWGEGPHVSSLALLPLALAFSWVAIRDGGRAWLALAAIFSALVVSHNFYGATALAILFPVLTWSIAITNWDRRVVARAAAIAALAYGLTAFWLTPAYMRITLENLKLVARPATAWSRAIAFAAAILFAWASARLTRGHKEQAWRVFVCGAAGFLLLIVAGSYYLNMRVGGEPHRLVPELDLVLILLAIEALRSFTTAGQGWRQVATAVALVTAFAAAFPYLSRPWSVFEADPHYQARVEYRLSEWIAHKLPGARVFAAGSLRLWYDAWHDSSQIGGGSEQGLINDKLEVAQWQVTREAEPGRGILWLQALGADAVVVHTQNSQEEFHEYTNPLKFGGYLPVLYDDGHGDIIYGVPRRFPAHARVVEKRRIEALRPIPASEYNREELAAYRAAVEEGPEREVEMRWQGPESISLRAHLQEGDALLVQESYDPAWRAYCGGRRIGVRKDPAGFMLLDAPSGEQEARMQFELPRENRGGRVLTGIAALITVCLCAGFPRIPKRSY